MATNTQRIAALETKVDNLIKSRAASDLGVVLHGDNAGEPRPGVTYKALLWIGAAEPANGAEGDIWIGGE